MTSESLNSVPRSETGPHRGILTSVIQLLRPKQWLKNLACFAGLVFSGHLFFSEFAIQAALGFVAFCGASSAVYVLNDFVDRKADRSNPRTSRRPLVTGDLPYWLAGLVGTALVALAGFGSSYLGVACTLVLGAYLALNVLYSLRLKQTVIADVICIAIGFVLRVVYGVYAVESVPTAWVVLCMFFLALFLGFGKRKGELGSSNDDRHLLRPVLSKYSMNYLDLLLAMSATMTIMSYALFTVASHKNPTLVITVIPVVYCVMRYLHQVTIQRKGASPEDIVLSDRMLLAGMIAWVGLCIAILYGNVQLLAERIDWPQ